MPSSASTADARVAALIPLPPADAAISIFGAMSNALPSSPRPSPTQWRAEMRSPSSGAATTAVRIGCRLTTSATTPAGMPLRTAQKTPPR